MKTLHMIGNAHLDMAWLWPWQEGFGEAKATFLSALQRLEEFEGFIFTSSSAQYYAWIEENAPDLFSRIRQQIQEKRWIICGGFWVQPDCNLPSGESFARQALYGQQYFHSRFGVTASVGYHVDSFGHNGGLPQILRKSGMDSYLFLRPGEHEMELPDGPFCWQGCDGSSVTACRIPVNYSSLTGLEQQIQAALERFPSGSNHFICFYGVGNHGGGPTIANIRYLLEHNRPAPDCRLIFSDPRTYFNAIAKEQHTLPAVQGELQHHAPGCYSVLSKIKQLNRKAEHLLPSAEIFTVLAGMLSVRQSPLFSLDKAWKQLLACQFHDVLAGVCTREVCEAAIHTLGGAISDGEQVSNHALQAISFAVSIPYEEECQPLVVFNPHSFPVRTVIYHEKGSWGNEGLPNPCQVLKSDGTPVPSQFIRTNAQLDQRRRIAFLAALPPMGYETFRITAAAHISAAPSCPPENILENEFVRIELNPANGLLCSYYDKTAKVQLLNAPSGYFLAHEDKSDTWAHGETRFDQAARKPEFLSLCRLEQGSVLQQIQVLFRLGQSQLRQTYTLRQDVSFLDVTVDLNWQETHTCLKLYTSLALQKPQTAWEAPFGAVKRPPSGTEEPMQSWADISGFTGNGQYRGMAFAGCGIGGGHINGSTIGLTLLRSPVYAHHTPHSLAEDTFTYDYTDQGEHHFRFLMLPHTGSWQESPLTREALLLNCPAVKITETFHDGILPQNFSGINISADHVLLSCLKPAEDSGGLILRLWESTGRQAHADIDGPFLSQCIKADFQPFEVKTWRIKKGHPAEECLLTEL